MELLLLVQLVNVALMGGAFKIPTKDIITPLLTIYRVNDAAHLPWFRIKFVSLPNSGVIWRLPKTLEKAAILLYFFNGPFNLPLFLPFPKHKIVRIKRGVRGL